MMWNPAKVRPFGPTLERKPRILDLVGKNYVSGKWGLELVTTSEQTQDLIKLSYPSQASPVITKVGAYSWCR